jgi:ABC-type antimicrobial peptide transport system permease subunit
MIIRIGVLILAIALTGCAATKGFVTGVGGGFSTVDAVSEGLAETGSIKTELPRTAHLGFSIASIIIALPIGVTYVGMCGAYGAYRFDKDAKKLK